MTVKYQVMGRPLEDGPIKAYTPLRTKAEAEKLMEAARHDHPDWEFEIEERTDC